MKTAMVAMRGSEFLNKVKAIKAVRGLTGMGLRESKDFVESLPGSITLDLSEELAVEYIEMANDGGIKIQIQYPNNPIRKEIAEQITAVLSYASISGQYDVSSALLNVLETHFPYRREEAEAEESD